MDLANIAAGQHDLKTQSDANAAEAFKTLGYRLNEGEAPDAQEIHKILADAKKTVDDLTKLVAIIESRFLSKKKLDEKERADERIDAVDEKLEQFDAEHSKAVEKYNEQTGPLREERETLAAAQKQGVVARQALIDSTLNEAVTEELAELTAKRKANARRKAQIQGALFETDSNFGRQPRRSLTAEKSAEITIEDRRLDEELAAIGQRRQELIELALIP